MKVLFLTRRFYPEIGGVEKHVFEIAKNLEVRGHKVTVISEDANLHDNKGQYYQSSSQSDIQGIKLTQGVKSVQTASFETGKIKVYRLNLGKNTWLKKFRIWLAMFSVWKQVANADVVHCHDVFFWYLPFRFLFPTRKVFTTFHGHETKFPPRPGSIVVRKVSELLSNGNICVGKYIERWYGTRADYITYGGVEEKLKVKSAKFKVQGKLKILFFGRIDKDNGVSVYLAALKELKRQKTGFDFIACGDGKMRKKVERWGRVLGFVQNPGKYINEADIVFASSYLSMLEALLAKKPVFAVYQNALKRDYLEMSPFAEHIYISASAEDLVRKITNSNSADVNRGYEWARKQTWDKVTDTYLKLWRK